MPVVYKKAAKSKLTISFTGGQQKTLEGQGLDKETTAQLFARNNTIEKIEVEIKI